MKLSRSIIICSLFTSIIALAAPAFGQAAAGRTPDQNAKNVCIDTHLTLQFAQPPALGKAGKVTIYDAATDKLVDTIDVGIPPTQQSYTIGGSVLHAYPIIINGDAAVIYPHNNLLAYGKTYYVQMDAGTLTVDNEPVSAIAGKDAWVFSTKAAGPAAGTDRITVAPDGTGDFLTVQGAIDWVPANNPKNITIFLKKGTYTEIVAFKDKDNVTFQGEDRKATIVQYANHDRLQPLNGSASGSSYRRGVFMGFNSSGIVINNFTVHNISPQSDQAEGILFKEFRGQQGSNKTQVIVSHMDLISTIDTIQITGKAYLDDDYVEGDNDYMWGDGPCYFINCVFRDIHDGTSFTQPRNPATHHGFVIVDSTFEGSPSTHAAYLGNGSGAAETVLINCKIGPVIRPQGWNTRGANDIEFNTTNLEDGKPYDMSQWPAFVKHLDKDKDAELIANYRNPSWVLGGWTPNPPAN